jgi:hypothetical protein
MTLILLIIISAESREPKPEIIPDQDKAQSVKYTSAGFASNETAERNIFTKPGSAANITLTMDDTLNVNGAQRDTPLQKDNRITGDVLTRNTSSSPGVGTPSTATNLVFNFNDSFPLHWVPVAPSTHRAIEPTNPLEIALGLEEDTPPASPMLPPHPWLTILRCRRKKLRDLKMQQSGMCLVEARCNNKKLDVDEAYKGKIRAQLDFASPDLWMFPCCGDGGRNEDIRKQRGTRHKPTK